MKRRTTILLPIALLSGGVGLFAAACSDSSSSSGPGDSGTDSTTGSDAARDSATPDVTPAEAAPPKDGAPETGPADAADSGLAETGPSETGPSETGPAETGAADTGTDGAAEAAVSPIVALPGYTVSVFAMGGTTYKGPDSLDLDGMGHVWVGYQMGVASKNGMDAGGPLVSQIVQYNLADGTPTGKSFPINGHADGVRVDPVSHIVWATSNEDGNPVVVSYDPSTPTVLPKMYTLPVMPHGGGLDDIAFIDGKMIVAMSAPNADDAGVYSFPALSQMTVNGSALAFAPILAGNAQATDLTALDAGTTALSLTDPDSLSIDDKGQLVLVSQGDSELIFIKNPGGSDAGAQMVTKLGVGTQLDDTVWAKSTTGMLLVADATTNTIYSIKSTFTPGTVYTETPDDSTVPGIVATVDPTNGSVHPVVLGFKKPTGMVFVP